MESDTETFSGEEGKLYDGPIRKHDGKFYHDCFPCPIGKDVAPNDSVRTVIKELTLLGVLESPNDDRWSNTKPPRGDQWSKDDKFQQKLKETMKTHRKRTKDRILALPISLDNLFAVEDAGSEIFFADDIFACCMHKACCFFTEQFWGLAYRHLGDSPAAKTERRNMEPFPRRSPDNYLSQKTLPIPDRPLVEILEGLIRNRSRVLGKLFPNLDSMLVAAGAVVFTSSTAMSERFVRDPIGQYWRLGPVASYPFHTVRNVDLQRGPISTSNSVSTKFSSTDAPSAMSSDAHQAKPVFRDVAVSLWSLAGDKICPKVIGDWCSNLSGPANMKKLTHQMSGENLRKKLYSVFDRREVGFHKAMTKFSKRWFGAVSSRTELDTVHEGNDGHSHIPMVTFEERALYFGHCTIDKGSVEDLTLSKMSRFRSISKCARREYKRDPSWKPFVDPRWVWRCKNWRHIGVMFRQMSMEICFGSDRRGSMESATGPGDEDDEIFNPGPNARFHLWDLQENRVRIVNQDTAEVDEEVYPIKHHDSDLYVSYVIYNGKAHAFAWDWAAHRDNFSYFLERCAKTLTRENYPDTEWYQVMRLLCVEEVNRGRRGAGGKFHVEEVAEPISVVAPESLNSTRLNLSVKEASGSSGSAVDESSSVSEESDDSFNDEGFMDYSNFDWTSHDRNCVIAVDRSTASDEEIADLLSEEPSLKGFLASLAKMEEIEGYQRVRGLKDVDICFQGHFLGTHFTGPDGDSERIPTRDSARLLRKDQFTWCMLDLLKDYVFVDETRKRRSDKNNIAAVDGGDLPPQAPNGTNRSLSMEKKLVDSGEFVDNFNEAVSPAKSDKLNANDDNILAEEEDGLDLCSETLLGSSSKVPVDSSDSVLLFVIL